MLRDLINFRLMGDPKKLLKTINPSESYLFDAATRIYVRFRLGGTFFPPQLFYKVFCDGPVCDLGLFAPRLYTGESRSQTRSGQKDIRGFTVVENSARVGRKRFKTKMNIDHNNMNGWYVRKDNNFWRPITQIVQIELLRYHQIQKKTKKATQKCNEKRVDKTGNMCYVGNRKSMLQKQKPDITEVEFHEPDHAIVLTPVVKDSKKHADFDSEVDTILAWSDSLDIDDYAKNWTVLGTSWVSEPFFKSS